MFLKITKSKSGSYARIVESYRDENGKPKHKTISNIGNIKNFGVDKIIELSDSLLKFANVKDHNLLQDFKELNRYNYGFFSVFDQILSKIGLKALLKSIGSNNSSIDLYKTVLLMLMERIRNPSSKRENFFNQNKHFNFKNDTIPLSHLYRTLDKIEENADKIKQTLFKSNKAIDTDCDVIFYDVTTFYFDSDKEHSGKLRQKGFSKDGKIGKTQVVLGLLIDKNQVPIDYFLYPGDKYEGATLVDALDSLKEKYKIDRSIIVTDTGMMSLNNINKIKSLKGYSYIIGERFKSLPNNIKDIYLNKANYKSKVELLDKSTGENIHIQYFEHEYKDKDKRLIFTYSEKRARKDKYEREKRLEKALKFISNPSLMNKKESSYYIKQVSSKKYVLDEKKINLSRQYDGLRCIATNNKFLKVSEILSNYKELYKIEHSFRSMKGYLETRPMYHWTDIRISGHICLCFMSYYVLRYLQRKLELKSIYVSEKELRSLLNEVEVSYVESRKKRYYLSSKNTSKISAILEALKIKRLPDFIPEISIKQYISV